MKRSDWIQLSGWGLAVSGLLFMAGMAASTRPTYNPYNAASWPVDPLLNRVDLILVTLGMLLMSAGMAGLLERFKNRASSLGRGGLVIGIIAGLTSAVGAIGLGFSDSGPWWNLFMVGLLGVNLALVPFGISCLRERLFTSWNGIPLVAGGVFFLFAVVSMGLVEWPETVVTSMFFFFAASLGLIGYRLQSEAKGQQVAAV